MTLVIEDGSQIAGANSYATVQQAKDFCSNRGFIFPTLDADIEPLLIKACDYLETLNWRGNKTADLQALAWPRSDVFLGATEIDDDFIPAKLILAQCRLAYDATLNPDLLPTGDGRQVVREKVDVLEVQYSDQQAGSILPQYNAALAMLDALLLDGGSFGLRTIRV